MIKFGGLFVLVVGLALWVFLAGALLEGVGSGGALLATVSPTRSSPTEPTIAGPAAAASPTAAATASPAPTPAPPTPTPSPAATPQPTSYTVVAGDNLTRLASRFGVTLDALARANNLETTSGVRVGQVLVIPPR